MARAAQIPRERGWAGWRGDADDERVHAPFALLHLPAQSPSYQFEGKADQGQLLVWAESLKEKSAAAAREIQDRQRR